MVGNNVIERRVYFIGCFNADDFLNNVLRGRQEYCVGLWLSLLGGNATTNVTDTRMFGIVSIDLV